MKNRNGFVSNSSSSSFIIDHGDIKEIAFSMLSTVIDDWKDWDDDDGTDDGDNIYSDWKSNLENALVFIKDNDDVGIMIPSCSEDTYIAKSDGVLYISTCNNHTWDIDSPDCEYVDELRDIISNVISDKYFFDIRNCRIHSDMKVPDDNSKFVCEECDSPAYFYYDTLGHKKICDKCIRKVIKFPSKDTGCFFCPVNGEKCEKFIR